MSPIGWCDDEALERALPAARLPDLKTAFIRLLPPKTRTSTPPDAAVGVEAHGNPEGQSSAAPARWPAGRPSATGKGRPRNRRAEVLPDGLRRVPARPGTTDPITMPCSRSNVPDRSNWVNIRSSRYALFADVFPEEDRPRAPDTASGVPARDARSERHPPTRGPSGPRRRRGRPDGVEAMAPREPRPRARAPSRASSSARHLDGDHRAVERDESGLREEGEEAP